MVNKEKKRAIWYLYVPIAVTFFYTAYYFQLNVTPFINVDYAVFLSLAVLVGLFPIKTDDSILFLVNGISLPVLVIFGLFPEMIVSSIAIVFLMIKSNIKLDQHYRYPLNLLMFNFLSIISAGFYYLTIMLTNQLFSVTAELLALTMYMLTHIIFNQMAMCIINKYFYGNSNIKIIDENLIFSLYITIFVVPLSYILIYLYETTGSVGIIIGALPFVTVTIWTNFYYKSKMNNKYLRKMNQFTQELNAKKNRESVIDMFIHALLEIFPADALSYFSIENEETIQREKVIVDKRNISTKKDIFKLSEQSVLKKAISSNKIISHADAKEWKGYCTNDLLYEAESAIVIPIKLLERTQGVILITHKTRSMYDEMIVSLVEVFHKYFSIALDNAYHYEQLEESVAKDYLTDLPNLKGLSKHLQLLKDEESVNQLSLIVLDLDRFKKVNDTHGHQAGNEILKQLAKLLRKQLNEDAYIARFGGEEFIVLLPGYNQEDGYAVAEDIRKTIENNLFEISNSIQTNLQEFIFITASLGVATCSAPCDEVEELINLADRAMYIGSKQNGRNKVTVAKKEVNL
ncbi:sensor domain-containing diguanylate cyclase [Alkalibacterium sp. f15]|uniref:sensor domain-containing diguanylate cyclase n=1 Tax=Alkalibacterium sp. f15 TaxID=3414029 RepID=UPI003BF8A328